MCYFMQPWDGKWILLRKPKCWQNNLPEVDYNGNGCLRFVSPNHLKPENQKTPSLLFTFRKWPYPPWRKHGEMAALVSATEKGWLVLTGHHFPFMKQILHTLTSICFILFVILFLKKLFLYLIKTIMCCFFSDDIERTNHIYFNLTWNPQGSCPSIVELSGKTAWFSLPLHLVGPSSIRKVNFPPQCVGRMASILTHPVWGEAHACFVEMVTGASLQSFPL